MASRDRPQDFQIAEGHRLAQYQAWDMIAGLSGPQLGGDARLLDIVGVNYYSNNQWIHGEATIDVDHPLHRIFMEIYARYGRPVLLAETGIEFDRRPAWLRYAATELALARRKGVPVEGLCLYPVLNHSGWDDDRPCQNGLLEQERADGRRSVYAPLAVELSRWTSRAKDSGDATWTLIAPVWIVGHSARMRTGTDLAAGVLLACA